MVNLLLHRRSVCVWLDRLERHAAVGDATLMALEGFDDLVQGYWLSGVAVPGESLDSVDHSVQRGLVVEGEVPTIGLLDQLHQGVGTSRVEVFEDHVLPSVRVDPLPGTEVSESADELVFAVRKIFLDLRHVGAGKIAVERYHLRHAIPPRILCKVFHPTPLVVFRSLRLAGLLSVSPQKHLPIDKELVHPAGGQIEDVLSLRYLLRPLHAMLVAATALLSRGPPAPCRNSFAVQGRRGRRSIRSCFFGGIPSLAIVHAADEEKLPLVEVLEGQGDVLEIVHPLHVDPVVLMVENSFDPLVAWVMRRDDLPRARLDEDVVNHLSFASSNQHPGMHSLPFILVFLLLLLLLLLNEHGNGLLLLLRQLLVQSIELVALHHKRAVEHRALLHSVDRLLLDVTIDHFELCFLSPRAALRGSAPTMRHHRLDRLVRQADPLLGIAYDDVGVVSYTNKQACQHNAHIETIPCLPVQDAGRGGDVLGEDKGVPQVLVLDMLGNEQRTGLQVVDFVVLQLGRPHRCADKLLHPTLVPGEEQQFLSMRIQLNKLAAKVLDILQHQ
mmetsp:Transcript_25936/g.58548  ORF Transcript_25936/g.58548 Transcript_25936/m.58548 type:complete len:556 (+) Transcript_25936:595-2262(+)